ncbi:MAG: DUF3999 domain-containing protein [Desulforhopalus sp.]
MRYVLALLILLTSAELLMAGDIAPSDFAVGYNLEVDKEGTIYSVAIPEDVYRTVQSSDLQDVRIFNGAGEVVPHGIRNVETDPATLRDTWTVPFFPLFQDIRSSDQSEFSLQVSRDRAGTIVNIQSDPVKETDNKKVSGYLLDLSNLKQAVSELEFQWEEDTDSSIFTVNIEQSNDLIHWSSLVKKATLVDLQFGGRQVERRTIQLPRSPQQYLKLTWQKSNGLLSLIRISGFSQVIEERRKYQWLSLDDGTISKKDDQLLIDFKTTYRLPVSRVQIQFPEKNSIAGLSIQSRSDRDAGWATRCEEVFHDLTLEGSAIQNEPCIFQPVVDPLWRIVVKQDGAGLQSGNKALTLQLGWLPSELLFVGRGASPYLLAFGSGKLAQEDKQTDDAMLLQAIRIKPQEQAINVAKLGEKVELAGDLALKSPKKPLPWKQLLLWAVLLSGVVLLAFMARSLIKEMKAAEEKKGV